VLSRAAIDLGDAADFAILAGSTIASTGTTALLGQMGLSPGTAISSTGSMTVLGEDFPAYTTYVFTGPTNAIAIAAKAAVLTAYNAAAALVPTQTWGPIHIIDTAILTPGVYKAPSSLAITDALTLDAGNAPDAVWVFQCGSTLVVTGQVILENGALAENVFWQVGSSATLVGGSHTVGTVMAMVSITSAAPTAGTLPTSIDGRLFAITAAVTLTGVGEVGLGAANPNSGGGGGGGFGGGVGAGPQGESCLSLDW
jgi:hypothetical protein